MAMLNYQRVLEDYELYIYIYHWIHQVYHMDNNYPFIDDDLLC